MYRSLVQSLYASPASLAVGATAGICLGSTVAYVADSPIVTVTASLLGMVALVRVISAIYFHRQWRDDTPTKVRSWEAAYEMGAWLYASLIGLLALATLVASKDPAVHLLTVPLVAGYAGGISGRNVGRLRIAIGQVCLCIAPAVVGLWMQGSFPYFVLGGMILIMIPGMAEISSTTHRIVVEALVGEREKSVLAAKFERLARYDNLTGLENRMVMQMRLHDLMPPGDDCSTQVAIIWLDLDRFKEINDSLGHMVGDRLLCSVAERLSLALHDRGYLARFGGDEFVIIAPGIGETLASEIAEDIIDCLKYDFDIHGHRLALKTSIGIAVAPQHGRESEELLRHADLALYHAKAAGRGRYSCFNWTMKAKFDRLFEIESGLRTAIENGELSLRYQPIVDLEKGHVACCEALVRWHHPILGHVSPGEFIPVAESMGMIGALTEWVLGEACRTAASWPDETRIAVNISPSLLRGFDLPAAVVASLMGSGLAARRLELEVTESLFLEQNAQTNQLLADLQRIGLRLALDDFGTGYSSLSYLRSYRFDTIKVDQSFLAGVSDSETDRTIVKVVAQMATALGMETVAEGIETEEQLCYARDAGFSNAQGYLLCRPVDEASVAAFIAEPAHLMDAMAEQPTRKKAG